MINQYFERRVRRIAGTISLLTFLAFAMLAFNPAVAQKMSEADQKDRIADVYEQTKTAKTAKDFTQFVDSCKELQSLDFNDENHAYIKKLMAWGLNRRGEKRLETADLLLAAGNIEQGDQALISAATDFDQATHANPKRARAWLCRGIAHVRQHNLIDAISDFSKTIELSPKNAKAYFDRAEAFYQAGQFEKAIADYNFVLKRNSGDLQALTGRAHCYHAMADYQKAFADYDSVVGLSGNRPISLVNRAEANQMLGHWQDAYDDYVTSINLKPTGVALQKIAWMLATCPEESFLRPQEALQFCRRAMDITGETPKALETQAAAESANGNFEQAKVLQDRAQEMAKSNDKLLQSRLATYKNRNVSDSGRQAKRDTTQNR